MNYKPHIQKVRDSDYWSCNGVLGLSPVLAYRMWCRWRYKP